MPMQPDSQLPLLLKELTYLVVVLPAISVVCVNRQGEIICPNRSIGLPLNSIFNDLSADLYLSQTATTPATLARIHNFNISALTCNSL